MYYTVRKTWNSLRKQMKKIDKCIHHTNIYQKIDNYLEEIALGTLVHSRSKDECILKEYNDHWTEDFMNHEYLDTSKLQELSNIHKQEADKIDLMQCKKEHLDKVLQASKIKGEDFEDRNRIYMH